MFLFLFYECKFYHFKHLIHVLPSCSHPPDEPGLRSGSSSPPVGAPASQPYAPSVPSRALKPKELLNTLRQGEKEEKELLEETAKVEEVSSS